MKNLLIFIHLILLCCLIVGCQQSEEVAVEADIQDIKDVVSDYNVAVNASDIDSVMSVYADDAVLIPPNEPVIAGKETIRSLYQLIFDEFDVQRSYVIEDVKVSGNLAVIYDSCSVIDAPKAGGEPIIVPSVTINVLSKQSDNAWKIVYQMWSDERLLYPDQVK